MKEKPKLTRTEVKPHINRDEESLNPNSHDPNPAPWQIGNSVQEKRKGQTEGCGKGEYLHFVWT